MRHTPTFDSRTGAKQFAPLGSSDAKSALEALFAFADGQTDEPQRDTPRTQDIHTAACLPGTKSRHPKEVPRWMERFAEEVHKYLEEAPPLTDKEIEEYQEKEHQKRYAQAYRATEGFNRKRQEEKRRREGEQPSVGL